MTKTVYICDGCGAEKGETNHWFAVKLWPESVEQPAPRLEIRSFDDAGLNPQHYCGQACLIKRVSGFIGSLDGSK